MVITLIIIDLKSSQKRIVLWFNVLYKFEVDIKT